jgi:uncharacterized protein YegP (UPF0339 family)
MLAESLALNKPNLRIETLKSSSQNPTNWFDQFEILTKKWDSRTRGLEVASYFEDIALQKYKLMRKEESENYEKIREFMIQRLRPANHQFVVKSEFYSARQKAEESIERFGTRLLEYVKESGPEDRCVLSGDLSKVFRNGCRASIRQFLTVVGHELPFEMLWAKAREIEKSLKESEKEFSLNSVDEGVNAASERQPIRCYKCSNVGHMAKDCLSQTGPTQSTSIQCKFCGRNDHFTVPCRDYAEFKQTLNRQGQATQARPNYPASRERYQGTRQPQQQQNRPQYQSRPQQQSYQQQQRPRSHYQHNQQQSQANQQVQQQQQLGQQMPQQQQPQQVQQLQQSQAQGSSGQPIRCHKCNLNGHTARNCQTKN